MATSLTPGSSLLSCVDAINNKNVEAVVALSDSLVLFEIPMLKPNRLHGHGEIRRGLESAFQELATIKFKLNADPAESGSVAIAAGSLSVTRASARDEQHAVAIVTETRDNAIIRFSLYLNARNRRPWSDAAIL